MTVCVKLLVKQPKYYILYIITRILYIYYNMLQRALVVVT